MSSPYAKQFSLANIPYGVASWAAHPEHGIATRLEDKVIILDVLVDHGSLSNLSDAIQKALKQVGLQCRLPTCYQFYRLL